MTASATIDAGPARGRAQDLMLRGILWYQRGAEGRPSPCRFFPSCSEYGYEAIEVHGAWRGGWLTARRLVRCRPFGPSGFDPVPEPRPEAHVDEHDHPGCSHAEHVDVADDRPSSAPTTEPQPPEDAR